ncbi:MAG: alpha/beta hydrolase-fold protein [Actinomycetota bacterium]
MERVERFQIRGVPGLVQRVSFDGRIVDYWSPQTPTHHLLIAHDGQNVFDRRTATHRSTWQMAQSAIRVSERLGITPPAIIGVFHSSSDKNPLGRILDLAPQDPYQNGIPTPRDMNISIAPEQLQGNRYLEQITDRIAPTISKELGINLAEANTAIIGSSMGGLASLYALGKRPDFFGTCLALSTHWPVGGNALVDALINALPVPGTHKIWMSYGTKGHDASYGPFQKYADQKMLEAGWRKNHDFTARQFEKSGHNEKSWAKYLDQPMRFWLEN